jgi:uncharacterized membrane protein
MTTLGWIIMSLSLSSVIGLTVFCLYRVLTLPPAEVGNLDIAPLDITTPDQKHPD